MMKNIVLYFKFILALMMVFGSIKAQTIKENSMESKWKGKPISKKQIELILFQNKYQNVSTKYHEHVLPGEQFFLIDDNRLVLQFSSGNGVVYPTVKDYMETCVKPAEPFFPKINSDFDKKIPRLIVQLGGVLGLKLNESDRLDKLKQVDEKLREKGWVNLNRENLILPLSAYCAQILKNESNGKINIESDSNCEYQVIVTSINGNRFNPYIIVTGEFINAPDNISFLGLISELIYPTFFLKGAHEE